MICLNDKSCVCAFKRNIVSIYFCLLSTYRPIVYLSVVGTLLFNILKHQAYDNLQFDACIDECKLTFMLPTHGITLRYHDKHYYRHCLPISIDNVKKLRCVAGFGDFFSFAHVIERSVGSIR